MLSAYATNPAQNWKNKDAAIYLVTSLASKGKTEKHGITQTNHFVNILDFYQAHILPELVNPDGKKFHLCHVSVGPHVSHPFSNSERTSRLESRRHQVRYDLPESTSSKYYQGEYWTVGEIPHIHGLRGSHLCSFFNRQNPTRSSGRWENSSVRPFFAQLSICNFIHNF